MLNDKGYEVPDPVPLAKLFNVTAEESLADKIKRLVRFELSQQVKEVAETWEEADDFDVGDDPELSSPYELSEEIYDEQESPQVDRAEPVQPAGKAEGGNGEPSTPGE